jgi:hypothetical protein
MMQYKTDVSIQRGIKGLVLAGILLTLWGCETVAPPMREDVLPQHPASLNDIPKMIYLDTSESMKGFAVQDGQYEKALWELRTLLNKQNTQVYLVGNNVDASARSVEVIGEAGRNRNLYVMDQDNLAAAIARFNRSNTNSGEDSSQVNSADKDKNVASASGIHVLITDGVQSLYQQSSTEGCDQGADWICVKQELQALLHKGWAGCVIGIRSQFDGLIFPEKDGRRGRFPYKSTQSNLQTFRPFYFYLFSPSRKQLAEFVTQLRKKLSENLIKHSYEMAELTSLASIVPVTIIDKKYTKNERLAVTEEQVTNDPKFQNYSRLTIYTTVQTGEPYSLTVDIASQASDETSEVTWKLVPVHFGAMKPGKKPLERDVALRYPEMKLIRDQATTEELCVKIKDGVCSLQMAIGWPDEPGTTGWRVYRLDGFTNSTNPLDWIQKWSTNDDTVRNQANRTLFLDKMVGELWETSPSKDNKILELYLWVGPKQD